MSKKATKLMSVLMLSLGILLLVQTTGIADEVRIVRLMKHPYPAGGVDDRLEYVIQPNSLLVKKGTVVVFMNWGAYQAKVIFKDLEACKLAFDAAEGFELDETKKCFVARIVANGGTKSVKFNKKGTYEYEVEWYKRPEPSRGKIIVY